MQEIILSFMKKITYIGMLKFYLLYGRVCDEIKGILKALVSLVYSWNAYTYGYLLYLVHFRRLIGRQLGFNAENEEQLILGTYLHDIEKLDVDKFILNKHTPFEEDEWLDLNDHPPRGVQLIQACKDLKPYEIFILHYHERYIVEDIHFVCKERKFPFLFVL